MFFSFYRILKIILRLPLAALGLPPHSCRFTPSCSHYCGQAVTRFGYTKGGLLCVKRILRCHPGTPPGYDPLPS